MSAIKAFARFLWKDRMSIGIAWAVIFLLLFPEFHGWFASIEGHVFDTGASRTWTSLMALRPEPDIPEVPPVIVVDIDDSSYHACFGGTSPLQPKKIQAVIQELRTRAPSNVIAVDLITKLSDYAAFEDTSRRVVWAIGAEPEDEEQTFGHWFWGNEDARRVVLTSVPGTEIWAVPAFPVDEDAAVRRLPRYFRYYPDPVHPLDHKFAPTLATRVASILQEDRNELPVLEESEVLLDFGSLKPKRISVLELFATAQALSPLAQYRDAAENRFCSPPPSDTHTHAKVLRGFDAKPPSTEDWQRGIVLFGGTFAEARDFVRSPLGRTPGVAVNAIAITAELERRHLHERPRYQLFVLDLVVALALGYGLSGRALTAIRLLIIFICCAVLSWVLALVLYLSAHVAWVSWGGPLIGAIAGYMAEVLRRNPVIPDKH